MIIYTQQSQSIRAIFNNNNNAIVDKISFELKFSRYGNVLRTSTTLFLALLVQFLIAEIKREVQDKIFELRNLNQFCFALMARRNFMTFLTREAEERRISTHHHILGAIMIVSFCL